MVRTIDWRRWLTAFTLIEMLTVIAIIGILAGILIPTTQVIIRKARIASARSDVRSIEQAVSAYTLDFGAPPPDAVVAASWPFPADLNPNETLVWFLTRQYTKTADGAGAPWPPGNTNWGSGPQNCETIFARISHGKYLDVPKKGRTDAVLPAGTAGNGYYEFRDPWGRPYLYRAYPITSAAIAAAAPQGAGPYTVELTLAGITRLTGTVGKIQLLGFQPSTYNGTFEYIGSGDSTVQIKFNTSPGAVTTSGSYRFPLHKSEGVDIYSLGPNGRTRANAKPDSGEWKVFNATEMAKWTEVWGTSGDGNDLESGGNIVTEEKQRDDVANWE